MLDAYILGVLLLAISPAPVQDVAPVKEIGTHVVVNNYSKEFGELEQVKVQHKDGKLNFVYTIDFDGIQGEKNCYSRFDIDGFNFDSKTGTGNFNDSWDFEYSMDYPQQEKYSIELYTENYGTYEFEIFGEDKYIFDFTDGDYKVKVWDYDN